MRSIRTTSRTRMNARYDAADIEVLSGLDPVKRRPGMYTDTTRPNHLAQEVVDNAVDEALAGHAREIAVVLYADGSCEVSDDGRGMPVDIHTEETIPGVELHGRSSWRERVCLWGLILAVAVSIQKK